MFTVADSHVRDAQLSLSEFQEHITIDKLEEAVAPIGKLDLTRLDKGFVGDHRQISIPVLFKMLDKVNTAGWGFPARPLFFVCIGLRSTPIKASKLVRPIHTR